MFLRTSSHNIPYTAKNESRSSHQLFCACGNSHLRRFAEKGGFEPPVRLPVRQFSKLLVSATHPSLLRRNSFATKFVALRQKVATVAPLSSESELSSDGSCSESIFFKSGCKSTAFFSILQILLHFFCLFPLFVVILHVFCGGSADAKCRN